MNARSTRQALNLMTQKVLKSMTTHMDCVYIAHGGVLPLAEKLKEKILELIPRINVRMDYLTPALGIHGGPSSLVLSLKGALRSKILQDVPGYNKLGLALADA